MSLTVNSTIKAVNGFLSAEVDGEITVMNATTGQYIVLNSSASAILRLLDRPLTIAELSARLAEQYKATPEQIAADVLPACAEMVRLQLLEIP